MTSMFDIGHLVEAQLPALLADSQAWRSKKIDYSPPIVDRIFRDWEHEGVGYRIYLHRIYACERAFFHPHPWPSWIRVIGAPGSFYEMGIGFGPSGRHDPPPIACTVRMGPGSEYEMVHVDGWHYVKVLGEPSYSLMVSGPVWDRDAPRTDRHTFRELNGAEFSSLEAAIRAHYGF